MCLSESQSPGRRAVRSVSLNNASVLMWSFSCPAGGIAAALAISGISGLSSKAGWDELYSTRFDCSLFSRLVAGVWLISVVGADFLIKGAE